MTRLFEESKKQRKYVDSALVIKDWKSLEPYFNHLSKRNIRSEKNMIQWLKDRSELESVIEEEGAWRFIKMHCHTENKEFTEHFNYFITSIEPNVNRYFHVLDKKAMESGWLKKLDKRKYFTLVRAINTRIEIFREKNIPIIAQLQKEEQEYGVVSSKMTVHYENKELTLQQAANYLKNTDRDVRKKVYDLIAERRLKKVDVFNEILDRLIKKRHQVAVNADFTNYRDYRFASLGRFDYNTEDCYRFHETIKDEVCPLVDSLQRERKVKLRLSKVKPWDVEVDPDLKPPLKPFDTSRELIDKTIECFHEIRPRYGDFIKIMDENGYLDLDSRIGKAPGGFNYPLYESNVPFVFMNSAGSLRDLETMIHEGGHAIHSFLSKDLELVHFKNVPAEVAELASMSMELVSMEHWHVFFKDRDELVRAKRSQLEGTIKILPWIACVDKFQHWLYSNPDHTQRQRTETWITVFKEFSSAEIDYTGQEDSFANTWQKQLHIFQYPFYYIEYGIAQLGAIAIWRNYIRNTSKALDDFEAALCLGYSFPISELYKTAGIKFDFSKDYISELMAFVKEELDKLD